MCGRAAQTVYAAHCAASSFGIPRPAAAAPPSEQNDESKQNEEAPAGETAKKYSGERDNYNMSPGMDASVIWEENGKLQMDRKM